MDAELYELLTELGRAGYLIQSYREDQHGPAVVTGVRTRGDCADVVVLHDERTAYAWRTPTGAGLDELDPAEVRWQIAGRPTRVLTELLALPAPGTRAAPMEVMAAMPDIGLPVERRGQPIRMRYR